MRLPLCQVSAVTGLGLIDDSLKEECEICEAYGSEGKVNIRCINSRSSSRNGRGEEVLSELFGTSLVRWSNAYGIAGAVRDFVAVTKDLRRTYNC